MTHLAGSSRLLRAMNEIAALSHLLERGELTRADLRELTGLSKPTISEAVRRLTDAGLVIVVGHVSAGPGPNAEVYAANPQAAYVIAVSIRDTFLGHSPSLAAAVCDVSGTVRARLEVPVDFEHTDPVDAVASVVERLRTTVAVSGTGYVQTGYVQIGIAGAYDPRTGIIHHVDVPSWRRPGLVAELGHRIGLRVEVDNHANLAAAAERRRGVAGDFDGFALLWLDEGLGLAIDLGGTLLRGARGGAGEIGYLPLYHLDGERRADLQDLIGGDAVQNLAAEHGLGGRSTVDAVALAARAGQAGAQFLAALAERIAVGLAAVVAVLNPPLVVLGGQVAQAGGISLRDAVRVAMRAHEPLETMIEITAVTDDPVLLGGLDAGLSQVREVLLASLHN